MRRAVGWLPLALAVVPCIHAENITFFNWQPICEGTETTCGWAAGRSMTIAAQLMVERINEVGFLRGGHQLRLVVEDTACGRQGGLEKTANLLLRPAGERPFGVIGCGCSGCTTVAAPILTIARVPLISQSATSASLSDREAYPNFFRIQPPDTPAVRALLILFQSWGWKKLGMVIDAASEERWIAWWQSTLESLNMVDVLANLRSRVLADENESRARVALNDIVRLKVRSVVVLLWASGVAAFACTMSQMQIRGLVISHLGWFAPDWVTATLDALRCTEAEMKAATELFINANPPPWNSFETPDPCSNGVYTVGDFASEYHKRRQAVGLEWRTEASSTADAICMMTKLINTLFDDGRSLQEISAMDGATYARSTEIMQRMRFEGISGTVTFPADGTSYGGGDRLAPFILYQRLNGSNTDVGILRPFELPAFFPGKQLLFEFGYTQENPPPDLFPTCDLGKVYEFVTRQCIGCPENREYIQAAGACLSVPGFFEASNGEVRPCPPGSYSSSAGAGLCDDCEVGKFSVAGASECAFCPKGTFAGSRRTANCTSCASVKSNTTTLSIASTSPASCVCEVGTYRLADGTCQVCPDGSSTSSDDKQSISACLCQEGTYMPLDGSACQPCPLGMKCDLGSSVANFLKMPGTLDREGEEEKVPLLLPGFYSGKEYGFLSVFSCRDNKRCLGGDPTSGACPPNSYGLACEHCEDFLYWSGTQCAACSGVHASQIFFPVTPSILVPFITMLLYFTKNKELVATRWNRVGNTRNALVFIILNHYQVVDLTRGAALELPLFVEDVIGLFSWTTDAGALFRVECTGYSRFEPTMVVKSLAPLVVMSLMVALYAVSVVVAKLTSINSIALSANRLFNVWGTVMFSFFTAIAGLSLLLFKCTSNPNGKITLTYDRSILCYETSAWKNMLGVAVAAVAVYVVGLGALFARTVYRAPLPGYFETPAFQTRWAFLFIRYRPEAYWFSMIYLLKNVLVNLGYVLFSDGVWQIYCCFCVQVVYTALVVVFRPYRSKWVYFAEILVSASLLNVAPLLTWYSDRGIEGTQFDDAVGVVLVAWSFVPLIVGGSIAGFLTVRAVVWKDKLREQLQREFSEVQRALTEFNAVLFEDGVEFYGKMGDWDRMLFWDTTRCIEVEVMGGSDKRRTSDKTMFEKFKQSKSRSTLTVDEGKENEPQREETTVADECTTSPQEEFAIPSVHELHDEEPSTTAVNPFAASLRHEISRPGVLRREQL